MLGGSERDALSYIVPALSDVDASLSMREIVELLSDEGMCIRNPAALLEFMRKSDAYDVCEADGEAVVRLRCKFPGVRDQESMLAHLRKNPGRGFVAQDLEVVFSGADVALQALLEDGEIAYLHRSVDTGVVAWRGRDVPRLPPVLQKVAKELRTPDDSPPEHMRMLRAVLGHAHAS
ncbi:MAG: hypothetical protein MHM6MM_006501 [Cercozoa sp. M6MM]